MNIQKEIAPHITGIIARLQDAGFEAYIVGGAVRDLPVDTAKALRFFRFPAETFDLPDPLNGIFHPAVQFPGLPPDLPESPVHPPLKNRPPQDNERQRDQCGKHHQRIQCHHHRNRAPHGQQRKQQILRAMVRHLCNLHQVIGKPGHDLPGGRFIKITKRQFLQMIEKILPHIRLHPCPQRMPPTRGDVAGK